MSDLLRMLAGGLSAYSTLSEKRRGEEFARERDRENFAQSLRLMQEQERLYRAREARREKADERKRFYADIQNDLRDMARQGVYVDEPRYQQARVQSTAGLAAPEAAAGVMEALRAAETFTPTASLAAPQAGDATAAGMIRAGTQGRDALMALRSGVSDVTNRLYDAPDDVVAGQLPDNWGQVTLPPSMVSARNAMRRAEASAAAAAERAAKVERDRGQREGTANLGKYADHLSRQVDDTRMRRGQLEQEVPAPWTEQMALTFPDSAAYNVARRAKLKQVESADSALADLTRRHGSVTNLLGLMAGVEQPAASGPVVRQMSSFGGATVPMADQPPNPADADFEAELEADKTAYAQALAAATAEAEAAAARGWTPQQLSQFMAKRVRALQQKYGMLPAE